MRPAPLAGQDGEHEMKLRDLKRYSGYMPVRMEREDTLSWIGELVGSRWLERMWLSKFSGYHTVRYRYADVQEAQVYTREKEWHGIPITIWLKLMELRRESLDDECWDWIRKERAWCGESVIRTVSPVRRPTGSPADILGL